MTHEDRMGYAREAAYGVAMKDDRKIDFVRLSPRRWVYWAPEARSWWVVSSKEKAEYDAAGYDGVHWCARTGRPATRREVARLGVPW